ncbi:MAG: Bud site selection protein 20 [Trizodia sp. TS-e1964]|nr:MAG: Bud site selection protein 20 [Trizodia sp. TS-e1964]
MGAIRRSKTKRRTRDIDQVHADIHSNGHLSRYLSTKAKEDLPGLGEFYCIECAQWLEGEHNLVQHRRGKKHKRRVRFLKETPYSQKEAELAVGLRTDNGTRSVTQADPEELEMVEEMLQEQEHIRPFASTTDDDASK